MGLVHCQMFFVIQTCVNLMSEKWGISYFFPWVYNLFLLINLAIKVEFRYYKYKRKYIHVQMTNFKKTLYTMACTRIVIISCKYVYFTNDYQAESSSVQMKICLLMIIKPDHDKTCFCHIWPTKKQIILCIIIIFLDSTMPKDAIYKSLRLS